MEKAINKRCLLWAMQLLCLAAVRNFPADEFQRRIQQIGDSKNITSGILYNLDLLRPLTDREDRLVRLGVRSIRQIILKPRTIRGTIHDLQDILCTKGKFIITGHQDSIQIKCSYNNCSLVKQVITDLGLTLFTYCAPCLKPGDPHCDELNTVFFVA